MSLASADLGTASRIPRGAVPLLALLLAGAPDAVPGQETEHARVDAAPDPAQVFARVRQVEGELSALREAMGRAEAPPLPIEVRGASPREVFFQAVTLVRKVDRLSFQVTRERGSIPGPRAAGVDPADVLAVVDTALARIRRVKAHLGVRGRVPPPGIEEERSPSDVFLAIIRANRRVNRLLDREFSPSEVYERVTRGIAFSAALLGGYRDVTVIPDPPALRPDRAPPDVYRRLLRCIDASRRIAERMGLEVLELHVPAGALQRVEPSDVYDVATLLVAELAAVHARVGDGRRVRRSYFPGPRTPPEVFRRVGILERQLAQLERLTAERGPPDLSLGALP